MTGDLHSDWTVRVLTPELKRQAYKRAELMREQERERRWLEKGRIAWEWRWALMQPLRAMANDKIEITVGNDANLNITLLENGRMDDVQSVLSIFEDHPDLTFNSSVDYEGTRMFSYRHDINELVFVIVHVGNSKHCRSVPTGEKRYFGAPQHVFKLECS